MRTQLLWHSARERLGAKGLESAGWQVAGVLVLGMIAAGLLTLQSMPVVVLLVLLVEAAAAGWLLATLPAAVFVALAAAVLLMGAFLGRTVVSESLIGIGAVTALGFFSHLSSAALVRVREATENDARVHELTFLLEAAQVLGETLERDRILTLAVRAVDQGISRPGRSRSSHASFHAVYGDEATITVAVDEPAAREQALGFTYPVKRNQAARAGLRSGRAAFVRPDHMTGSLLELAERLEWQVLAMAPVFASGSLIGFLAATARDTGSVDRGQLRMLEVLAQMTGLALGNAEDLEHERAEAERFRDAATPQITNQFLDQLRAMVEPLRGSAPASERVQTIDRLLAGLESRTALDTETGLLRRDVGLLALKRDVARAHRTLLGRHCIAYLTLKPLDKEKTAGLLNAVAAALRQRLRQEDLVFLDTDTDIVCSLSDMDVEMAWPIFNEVRSQLENQFGATPFSIGLTTLRNDQTAEDAVKAARSAVAPVRQRPGNAKRERVTSGL